MIEAAFKDYLAHAFPDTLLTPIQFQEMRRAFYAGAVTVWGELTGAVDETTADRLEAEIRAFADAVGAGEA